MTFRSMGVLIVFLVSLLFVVVNWGPIMTPMPISFILFTVNAPLGLFLIVGGALVFVVCLLWMLWKQATTLVDLQKANCEARTARAAAETAEGSRIVKFEEGLDERFVRFEKDLLEKVAGELKASRESDEAVKKDLQQTIEQMKQSLDASVKALKEVEEQTNQRLI